MYLVVKDGIITAYSRRNRMAIIGDFVVYDDVIQDNPWPDSELVYVPDSSWGEWLVDVGPEGVFMRDGLRYPEDCPVSPTPEELSAHVDYVTQWAISLKSHKTAWVGDQLGIMREQIVRMLNGDMTASEGFARLNSIAIAEIEKGQIEKAALNA